MTDVDFADRELDVMSVLWQKGSGTGRRSDASCAAAAAGKTAPSRTARSGARSERTRAVGEERRGDGTTDHLE